MSNISDGDFIDTIRMHDYGAFIGALESGANPDAQDADGDRAIHVACELALPSYVGELIERGAELNIPDHRGLYPCHISASYPDIFLELAANGCDYNVVDKYGSRAIHYAAMSGCEDVIKFLSENMDDVDVLDERGRTALEIVLSNRNDEIGVCAAYLVDAGADVTRIAESFPEDYESLLSRYERRRLSKSAIGEKVRDRPESSLGM